MLRPGAQVVRYAWGVGCLQDSSPCHSPPPPVSFSTCCYKLNLWCSAVFFEACQTLVRAEGESEHAAPRLAYPELDSEERDILTRCLWGGTGVKVADLPSPSEKAQILAALGGDLRSPARPRLPQSAGSSQRGNEEG